MSGGGLIRSSGSALRLSPPGAGLFFWLLAPPYLTDRRVRRERQREAEREGRGNQRQGLDEIARELGQISSQLKSELRWGKRGGLFPNTAWTKNQHLVTTPGIRLFVDSAYAAAYALSEQTIAASQEDLSEAETQERQDAKTTVDYAVQLIESLRGEVEL
jgi:hypothetical protein